MAERQLAEWQKLAKIVKGILQLGAEWQKQYNKE